jgi:triphosphoribosyl-dephospho-CoA synthetase
LESQHFGVSIHWLHSFKILFEDEAVSLEELKRGLARVIAAAEDTNIVFFEDIIEEVRLEAIEKISKYQAETTKWRYIKVKLKNIML